jgi:hypothetical protein
MRNRFMGRVLSGVIQGICKGAVVDLAARDRGKSFVYARHHQSKKEGNMSGVRIFAIILIIAGVIGLAYQQFSFTRETAQAKIGPIELSVKEKQTVNVPMWLSIGALGIGVLLLVTGRGKK